MSQFIENAREIFEAAQNSAATGMSSADYTILMGSAQGGAIHMIANSDWSLTALQQAHGAQVAYRVSQLNGRVMVEGREGHRTCQMESAVAHKTAQFLLNATPAWHARPSYAGLLAA